MTLHVPEALAEEREETVRFIAAKLYEAGKIRLGEAAEMCGMRKWDFAETLINYGIHYFEASALEDLEEFKKSAGK